MTDSIGQIGSSIDALTKEYYTIANNIANVNTTGYKRRVNSFSRELMNKISEGGIDKSLSAAEIVSNGATDFTQGSLVNTGRKLDVAVCGDGFLSLETPNGPVYTRNGTFQVNTQGQMVDSEGRIVAGDGGPIIIPPSVSELDINITTDGTVSAAGVNLGKLRLVDFGQDAGQLEPLGKSCFKAPEDVTPSTAQNATIRQGFQERSNVKLVEELVDLISVSRLYETSMSLLRKRQENSKAMLAVANS